MTSGNGVTMTYTDKADAELNRLVAERLGYSVGKWPSGYYGLRQNGKFIGRDFGTDTYITKVAAWETLPSWATDLNAAAALDFKDWTLHITRYPDGSVEVDVLYPIRREGENAMARAITEAWLLMGDAKGAGT